MVDYGLLEADTLSGAKYTGDWLNNQKHGMVRYMESVLVLFSRCLSALFMALLLPRTISLSYGPYSQW